MGHHSHSFLLPVSVRLPQTHQQRGVVINTTAEIQGQDLHEGSERGRRGMLQCRSCIPDIKHSSSGSWVLGLNIAYTCPTPEGFALSLKRTVICLQCWAHLPYLAQTVQITALTHSNRECDPHPHPRHWLLYSHWCREG